MNNDNKDNKKQAKILKTISKTNKKALILLFVFITIFVSIILFIFYYFFRSELYTSKKDDRELYFSILFINENEIPYGAYIGVVSSLHNRIGLVGLPKNTGLWVNGDKNKRSVSLERLYKDGGSKSVFNSIEGTIEKKLSYTMTIKAKEFSDIVDIFGGVDMYVESPINFTNNGYELSFDVGIWPFQGNKALAYLNYTTISGYESFEVLYRLEDILINAMISIIQSSELKSIMHSSSFRRKIFSKVRSNLRPPDIKSLFNILANVNEGSLIIEALDARIDGRGVLEPILNGSALIKQLDNMALYVGLKTQRSEINNEDINVIVLNATDVSGLADRINIRMRYRGFLAGEYGNFPYAKLKESVVLIRDGQIEKAFKVARECRISKVYSSTDRRVLNNAVLILGNDYYEIKR